MKMGYIVPILLVGLLIAVLFLPQLRQTFLKLRSEKVTIAQTDNGRPLVGAAALDLNIITVLGKDGIPAILDPVFLSAEEAQRNMRDGERVLGVSINGESKAYPLNLLSRHEIVNDTVGGKPVAVTW
ncbi:MAG: hypothetical protein BZY80_01285 [SAR202 cluster bacterium Io17-Chloro-G2]|nr:MAG: hypothetical protein BZY80_01285 [SAR202 cluster bacterium Io17-Chloro-G2]